MVTTHNIGAAGEQIAANYLTNNGFDIIHRNYRTGRLEVDIIARKGSALYFVEVKTRSCSVTTIDQFMPEAAMTPAKNSKIARAAQRFLEESDENHAGEIFIDLIAINISENSHQLRHYHAVQW